jgi:hypothetical protein
MIDEIDIPYYLRINPEPYPFDGLVNDDEDDD